LHDALPISHHRRAQGAAQPGAGDRRRAAYHVRRAQQPRQRGLRRTGGTLRRQCVPHHRPAQRAPGRGAEPRPEHRRLRQGQPRHDRLPRPGRRGAAPPARARTPARQTRIGRNPRMTPPAAQTTAEQRGLGRGLEALLGPKAAAEAPALEATPGDVLSTLRIDALAPARYQPRKTMDDAKLQELAESIRAQGVIQPIVVRETGRDRGGRTYEIIAGERRWRASRIAGLSEIPVVVREVDDRTVVAMALIENIQREDLNPLEEAQALQRLIDEFDLTHAQAAEAVGRSRAAVSNLLRLLELPPEIRTLVETRALEMGH